MHIIVIIVLIFILLLMLLASRIGAGQVIGRQMLLRELDWRSPHPIVAIVRAGHHRSRTRVLAA
jgi:hypothetical protein